AVERGAQLHQVAAADRAAAEGVQDLPGLLKHRLLVVHHHGGRGQQVVGELAHAGPVGADRVDVHPLGQVGGGEQRLGGVGGAADDVGAGDRGGRVGGGGRLDAGQLGAERGDQRLGAGR